MYAQLVHFDGPRSPEMVAASERAGLERIQPAVSSDPIVQAAHVATFVLRQPNGGEVVIVIAETEEALGRGNEIIRNTTLLPGEDPALLTDPDRTEVYEVVRAFGRDYTPIGATS